MLMARVIFGPCVFDRILAVNSISTHVIVLILLLGHWQHSSFYIDIAMVYALLNVVSTIALLRYVEYVGGRGQSVRGEDV